MVHVIKHATEVPLDRSDSEVSSLCGSELEREMAWGQGPIAPLQTTALVDNGTDKKSMMTSGKHCSSTNEGSSRARTPQKRGSASPLARSKRLINIHPIRSAGYLSNPNELPLSTRKQQRWFNDHHFGNCAASTRLEDLIKHMEINVEWRSNFQKLAEPQNKDLQTEFRQGSGAYENNPSYPRHKHCNDEWNAAEQMFHRVDRRARTLVLQSFNSFAPFIEAVEYVVLHFIQWREVPSELEIAAPLFRLLKRPIKLMKASEKDVQLILPVLDSAFHRLVIHSVCQFYGVRSRTEANCRLNAKIMVLKTPKKKSLLDDKVLISMCGFIRETRIARCQVVTSSFGNLTYNTNHALELQSRSSECSEGFCLVEAPQI